MKNTIMLIIGAIVTLLFLILSSPIFEAMYYDNEFSNEMYNQNLYLIVSIISALVAWALAGLYYYGINSVSFSRWYHWLIMLVVAIVIAPLANGIYLNNMLSVDGANFGHQVFSFCMIDLAVEAVLFIVVSFSIRWWSSNCRHTPIPE